MAIDFDALMTSVKDSFKTEKKTFEKAEKDPRFINVSRDEKDNGQLVLRLIPDKNGLGNVKTFSHFGSIKDDASGNKRWFIANCPTTLEGGKCPYCEAYLAAWKNGDEEMKSLLKSGKRNESYISNVVVVKDPMHPENNGKVMLYKYGYKVSKLIEEAISGDADAEIEPINIYHPIKGANLHLKNSRHGDYIVLDGSKFLTQSAIIKSMDEFEGILEQTYDLSEFLDHKLFESHEALEKKFFKYLNGYDMVDTGKKAEKPAKPVIESADLPWEDTPAPAAKKESKPAPAKTDVEEDDFFASL